MWLRVYMRRWWEREGGWRQRDVGSRKRAGAIGAVAASSQVHDVLGTICPPPNLASHSSLFDCMCEMRDRGRMLQAAHRITASCVG
jgi:hypothetical protein